jgi:hypothetical protein
MAIGDQLKEGILSVAGDLLDNQRTPLSDFESFVVTNPDIVDPGIDVSGLRTTTDANILGNIPDYEGIQYEAYNPNRLSDLIRLYSSGLPTLATDTAQIPGAIDTLVNVGGGGIGQDQVTGDSMLDTPTDGLTQSGTFGGQPTFTTTPGTTVDDVTGDITNPDGSFGGNIVDEFVTPPSGITGDPIDVGIPDNESGFVDPLGTIGGAPVVSPVLTNQGPTTIQGDLSQVQVPGVTQEDLTQAEIDAERLANYNTPKQKEDFFQNVLGRAGQTVEGALTELGKVPGAVVDFANKTVDVFGQKLDVGKTLAAAAINKVVGLPITLIFDAIGALGIKGGRSDLSNRLGEKYGMDDIGRLTGGPMAGYSVGPNHAQTVQDRIDNIKNRKAPQTEASEKKIAELEDYLSEVNYIGGDPVGANTELDIATGNITGDASVAEDAEAGGRQGALDARDDLAGVTTGDASVAEAEAAKDRNEAFADIQNQIGQSLHGGGGGNNGGGGSSSDGGEGGFGGFCFDPNTPIQMANGSNKKIKDIKLGDDTKGGEVTGVFQFKATDEIHDYKGVIVAGSHYVKENNKFIMVQDSPISVKIDKIPVVYSLDTTGRRIFIKDIEFADYNGDGIAKGFLHNAGVNTKGFDKEVLRQVEQRLI